MISLLEHLVMTTAFQMKVYQAAQARQDQETAQDPIESEVPSILEGEKILYYNQNYSMSCELTFLHLVSCLIAVLHHAFGHHPESSTLQP